MAQQSIVGSNTGLKTAPTATWRPSISLIYPTFNEEENIERAVHFGEPVLASITSGYEIVIVNDASTHRSRNNMTIIALS
jgi:hypothetical protein